MTDYDIHSCGYYCDRHACIVAQRNELRDKLFEGQAVKTYSGGKPNYTQPEETFEGWSLPESLLNSVHCQCGASWTFKDGALDYKPPKKQKEWVGLTDEEILAAGLSAGFKAGSVRFNLIVQSIEAKLKEKNT